MKTITLIDFLRECEGGPATSNVKLFKAMNALTKIGIPLIQISLEKTPITTGLVKQEFSNFAVVSGFYKSKREVELIMWCGGFMKPSNSKLKLTKEGLIILNESE